MCRVARYDMKVPVQCMVMGALLSRDLPICAGSALLCKSPVLMQLCADQVNLTACWCCWLLVGLQNIKYERSK